MSGGRQENKKPVSLALPIKEFKLFLFTNNPVIAKTALNGGADAIVVDWENQGKKLRQENFDTQINQDTFEDLCRLREIVPSGQLICRINGFSEDLTPCEIEHALEAGADEVFLPMVTSVEEVKKAINLINGRCHLNILIETIPALGLMSELSKMKLHRMYVGLNDLHIQQNSQNIFVPLVDGTVQNVRDSVTIPLGVGGVTYPPHGEPIASKYLINEYARLGIDFSFLRRTFLKDYQTLKMDYMIHHIKTAYYHAAAREPEQVEYDAIGFKEQVGSWFANPHFV